MSTTAQAKDADLDPMMIGAVFFGGLVLLALGYVMGLLLWLSGQVTGAVVHGEWPRAHPRNALKILVGLPGNLSDPAGAWPAAAQDAVGPAWLLYPVFLLLLVPLVYAGFFTVRYIIRFRRRREFRRMRLGFADGGEVSRLLSGKAVKKKAKSVRPSYKGKKGFHPLEVGYFLGRDIRSRQKLYCSVEDVMMVIAPPRQGKDVHFCIPNIIDAMGPCIATTTRADMFAATVTQREKYGTVWVFDPNKMTNWPDQMRWSPVNGCQDPITASNRAGAFVAGAGVGEGVQNASYWTGIATAILRCYLHAAALSGKTIRDVDRWAKQPINPEPIQILRAMEVEGRAAGGWAAELEASASADGETRGNMWSGVRRALDCFADPDVLNSCSPGPNEEFDVKQFVSGRNTMYVLGKEKKNGSVAPLVTAMMEDIFDQVRKIASRMPNSRIDPPLTVELNEVAHIAPMPNLPGYMGDSGGFSIALHIYLQSLAQARSKWGQDEAAVMWDTAAIRVVMGGSGHVNDLEDISRLMGEVDEKQKSVTKGAGGRSVSFSKQKRRVLSVDELRTLEFGHAVVIARAARPVETVLTPYWKRKDAKEISKGQARVNEIINTVPQDKGDANTALAVPRSQTLGQHPLSVAAMDNAGGGQYSQQAPSGMPNAQGAGGPALGSGQQVYGNGQPVSAGMSGTPPRNGDPNGGPIVPDNGMMPLVSSMPGYQPVSSMPASGIPGLPVSSMPGHGVPVSALPHQEMPGPFPPQGPQQFGAQQGGGQPDGQGQQRGTVYGGGRRVDPQMPGQESYGHSGHQSGQPANGQPQPQYGQDQYGPGQGQYSQGQAGQYGAGQYVQGQGGQYDSGQYEQGQYGQYGQGQDGQGGQYNSGQSGQGQGQYGQGPGGQYGSQSGQGGQYGGGDQYSAQPGQSQPQPGQQPPGENPQQYQQPGQNGVPNEASGQQEEQRQDRQGPQAALGWGVPRSDDER